MGERGWVYILDDNHNPVHVENDEKWFEWYTQEGNRRVGLTCIGDAEISTVFTGRDITPDRCMFETMVFGGKYDREFWRTKTWEEAEKKHGEIVKLIQSSNL